MFDSFGTLAAWVGAILGVVNFIVLFAKGRPLLYWHAMTDQECKPRRAVLQVVNRSSKPLHGRRILILHMHRGQAITYLPDEAMSTHQVAHAFEAWEAGAGVSFIVPPEGAGRIGFNLSKQTARAVVLVRWSMHGAGWPFSICWLDGTYHAGLSKAFSFGRK